MLRFLLLRVGRVFIAMVLCLTAVFVLLRIAGDPASMLLPSETPPDVRAEYRAQWGLDRPLPEQYALYFRGVLAGDLGRSLADHQPVVDILAECLPRTLLLGLVKQIGAACRPPQLLLPQACRPIANSRLRLWVDETIVGGMLRKVLEELKQVRIAFSGIVG